MFSVLSRAHTTKGAEQICSAPFKRVAAALPFQPMPTRLADGLGLGSRPTDSCEPDSPRGVIEPEYAVWFPRSTMLEN